MSTWKRKIKPVKLIKNNSFRAVNHGFYAKIRPWKGEWEEGYQLRIEPISLSSSSSPNVIKCSTLPKDVFFKDERLAVIERTLLVWLLNFSNNYIESKHKQVKHIIEATDVNIKRSPLPDNFFYFGYDISFIKKSEDKSRVFCTQLDMDYGGPSGKNDDDVKIFFKNFLKTHYKKNMNKFSLLEYCDKVSKDLRIKEVGSYVDFLEI